MGLWELFTATRISCLLPVLRFEGLVIAQGYAAQVLDIATQQAPLWVLWSAALWGVLGFVLVVVGLIVFNDVILATKQRNHPWETNGQEN